MEENVTYQDREKLGEYGNTCLQSQYLGRQSIQELLATLDDTRKQKAN